MKSIVLIGYMCVGKTTLGRSLAKMLNCSFYDLDWYIEERFRRKVPQIFAEDGEDVFRQIERSMLHEVAEFEDIILSCGGGTPCFFDNIDYLNQCAETVYLKASTETILQHLTFSKQERPLLKGKTPEELKTYIDNQIEAREPYYSKAKHIIDVNVLDSFEKVDFVTEHIIKTLNLYNR